MQGKYLKKRMNSLLYEIEELRKDIKHKEKDAYDLTVRPLAKEYELIFEYLGLKKYFFKKYSWAIPSKKSVSELVIHLPRNTEILEIGCGNGLWCKLLSYYGVKVIPTDDGSWGFENRFVEVEIINHIDALKKYSTSNALFLCWPPKQGKLASQCLEIFKGDFLIYIGERKGGCTGNKKFHIMLKKWNLLKTIDIPHFKEVNDSIFIYSKRFNLN